MINLDKGLCQIILYCKQWFKTTNLFDDLKILISKRCAIDPDLVSLDNIYWHLLEIIKECSIVYANNNYIYQDILKEMFKQKNSVSIDDMIRIAYIKIGLLPIKNDKGEKIIELGEPDYNWLPKEKKE